MGQIWWVCIKGAKKTLFGPKATLRPKINFAFVFNTSTSSGLIYIQGVRKKIRHFFSHPTSNRINSGPVCPIYLKINVLRLAIVDSMHSKFKVILTNCSRVIAVQIGWEKKCLIFFGTPCSPMKQGTKNTWCHPQAGLWLFSIPPLDLYVQWRLKSKLKINIHPNSNRCLMESLEKQPFLFFEVGIS